MFVVIFKLDPTSFTLSPSVTIKELALALGVPEVVSVHVVVFVVDVVVIIFAGASKLPLASTGISYFNPTLL